MPTLYLHIGTPKTATTAIQSFCLDNGEALEKRGFCYPFFPYQYHHVNRRRNGHFLAASISGENDESRAAAKEAVWREGMDEVARLLETHEGVILSDEAIWNIAGKKKELWKRLREEAAAGGYRIKIIVYLRYQISYLNSTWNQRVKSGYSERISKWSWEEFITSRYWEKAYALDYYRNLEMLSGEFGRDAVVVRVFEKEQWVGQSVYSDFLDALGIAMEDDFVIRAPEKNPALTGNAHEIKRILNGLPGYDDTTGTFVKKVMRVCAEKGDENHEYSMFSKEEEEQFMDQYRESNRRVAEDYLHRPDGVLFREEREKKEKYDPNNPYMYEDMIRCFGEMALRHQKTILEMKEESLKLQKEVSELNRKMDKIHIVYDHPVRSIGKWVTRRAGNREK